MSRSFRASKLPVFLRRHSVWVLSGALSFISWQAGAQVTTIDADVDTELNQLYQGGNTAPTVSVSNPAVNRTTNGRANGSANVTQQSALMQIQKQPTTLIEASPLAESRAESIRRGRQDEELKTEARIVEKLEQSRMEDEKKRAAVLFGDKFDSLSGQAPAVAPTANPPVQVVQPLPQQSVPPQIVLQKENDDTRDIVREEIRSALADEKTAITPPVEIRYFSGMVGMLDFPDVKNIKSNYSLGAGFGTKYDQFIVEGTFLMSNYQADILNYMYSTSGRTDSFDVNQYTGAIVAKYQMLGGLVRPVLGGTAAYSYRKFNLSNATYYPSLGQLDDSGSSHSADVGFVAGADLEFSPKVSLGLDFRYMFNISSRVNSNLANSVYSQANIEKLQYYIMALSGRVTF